MKLYTFTRILALAMADVFWACDLGNYKEIMGETTSW